MAQTLRIKSAGGLVKMSLSPRVKKSDGYQTRKEKKKLTSKAQKYINNKAKHDQLEFLLAANIVPGDKVVTLTYDNDHLPDNWIGANKCRTAFARKLRERCDGLIYFINIEGKHYSEAESQSHRWHHHAVLHCDLTPDEIEKIWGRGQIECHDFLLDADHTYGSMATYMIKESSEFPGKRAWASSKVLQKPETDSIIVPDDYKMPVPERTDTCMVLENDGAYVTEYGRYQQVKFQTLDKTLNPSLFLPHKKKKAGT